MCHKSLIHENNNVVKKIKKIEGFDHLRIQSTTKLQGSRYCKGAMAPTIVLSKKMKRSPFSKGKNEN